MLLLISLILTIKLVVGDWYHETKAFEITAENYKSIIGQQKHVMNMINRKIILDFFTPWCIYCQYMAGDWNLVYDYYNGAQGIRNEDILIAKINCGDEPNQPICREYEVRSFPTILHIQPGTTKADNSFRANRHYTDFIKWIDELCPASTEQQIKTDEILKLKEEMVQKQRLAEELVQQQRLVEEQINAEKLKLEIKPEIKDSAVTITLKNEDRISSNEFQQLNEKISHLTNQFDSVVKANEQLRELEETINLIESKINILHQQINQVNWYHSFVFITSGAFLGILVSFILIKHYSNKIEFEEKSV